MLALQLLRLIEHWWLVDSGQGAAVAEAAVSGTLVLQIFRLLKLVAWLNAGDEQLWQEQL
jgi:hypothetical protein